MPLKLWKESRGCQSHCAAAIKDNRGHPRGHYLLSLRHAAPPAQFPSVSLCVESAPATWTGNLEHGPRNNTLLAEMNDAEKKKRKATARVEKETRPPNPPSRLICAEIIHRRIFLSLSFSPRCELVLVIATLSRRSEKCGAFPWTTCFSHFYTDYLQHRLCIAKNLRGNNEFFIVF